MFMLKCPVCHERGISPWDKIFSSVWRKIICKDCGTRFKIGFKNMIVWNLLLYPIGLAILVLGFFASFYIGIVGGVLAFAALLALPLLIPLRKFDA